MREAKLLYPDQLAETLQIGEEELPRELAYFAAAKLYELGRLSSGEAAELAGMDRLAFLRRLSSAGAPAINLRDDEIREEIAAARDLAG
ncbi:MAG: UPF0175 family protein [Thermoanaerobaculia bacterium]